MLPSYPLFRRELVFRRGVLRLFHDQRRREPMKKPRPINDRGDQDSMQARLKVSSALRMPGGAGGLQANRLARRALRPSEAEAEQVALAQVDEDRAGQDVTTDEALDLLAGQR